MTGAPPTGAPPPDPRAVPPREAPSDPWAVPPRGAPPPDPWAVPPPAGPPGPRPAPPPGAPSVGTPPPPAAETPWLRLHPLTPLLRGGRLLALAAVFVYQQVLREAGAGVGAGLLAAALPVAVVYGLVAWLRTRYRLSGGDLQVETGVLVRRSRRVPLARLQAVDLVRGPVARVAGLAELHLEVVGGGRSEARLAYLTVADATALRARLLSLAHGPAAADPGAAPGTGRSVPGAQVGPPLLAVPPGRLVGSALLTGPALAGAVLLVAAAGALAVEPEGRRAVVATLLPGLLGAGGVLLRRLAVEWGFTAAESDEGLRLKHGLLETRTQSIPRGRVQGVRVLEPLLWRPLGWVRVEVDVAGYGSNQQEEQARTRALAPVASRADAVRLLTATLLDIDPGLVAAVVADGADTGTTPPPPRARVLAPLSLRRLAVGVGDRATVTTSGVLQRVAVVVPHAKVQSWRLVQGPLQRRLRLATLHLDTAGRYVAGTAPHRDVTEAQGLLADLVERGRAARERETGATGATGA